MASGQGDPATVDSSDESLAERVRAAGDTAAFAVLVTRYRVRVTALARRMLGASGASEEAEDVAQETFVAAYQKRTLFRKGAPFRPWLYKIAVNRCLDRLRAQARHPQVGDLEHLPETASEDDPLKTLLADERDTRIQEAIAALAPKYRAVFLLRHLDDLSYEEIALAMDLPLGTIKTHLFRARAELRAALTGYLKFE